MTASRETASETLSMLEERLGRIDFLVNGDTSEAQDAQRQNSVSASARLRTLERTLKSLAARSYPVSDILQLHNQHPELFHPAGPQAVPTTLAPASLVQLVLAHEQLCKTSASQLSALNENKDVPDPSSLPRLIAMQPRIDRLQAKQDEQTSEINELRIRSAKLVGSWYESGILDMGEKWAAWEERLRDCEIIVRRKEAAKRREEGLL